MIIQLFKYKLRIYICTIFAHLTYGFIFLILYKDLKGKGILFTFLLYDNNVLITVVYLMEVALSYNSIRSEEN